MDIHIPENLELAFVLLTPNFDSALCLYLLCKKIHTNNLNVHLHVGICTSASSESYSLNTVRNFVQHVSSLFPNIINNHVRNVRYYVTSEDDAVQILLAHKEACKEWAVSFCSEFEQGTNIAHYAIDSVSLDEEHLLAMEELYVKQLDNIRLVKDRERLSAVDYNSIAVPVIRPFIDGNVTRKEVYNKIVELGLIDLYNKTVSCNLSKKYEDIHEYSKPCGECYGCLEREYIESL